MVTNTVVCWHTGYLGLAVEELPTTGSEVDDEVLAHFPGTQLGGQLLRLDHS
ncbi:hypothetical protein ACFWOJ_36995 [Streptomyces sp. NPDC058439]|uniref:hypothetical protein n=1 Tax=Streptomyces sp. NPDC058439 TaxID=3346500 RepID=UPI00365BF800